MNEVQILFNMYIQKQFEHHLEQSLSRDLKLMSKKFVQLVDYQD